MEQAKVAALWSISTFCDCVLGINNQSMKKKLVLHITHYTVHGSNVWFISSLLPLKLTFIAESSFCWRLKLWAVINEGHGFREATGLLMTRGIFGGTCRDLKLGKWGTGTGGRKFSWGQLRRCWCRTWWRESIKDNWALDAKISNPVKELLRDALRNYITPDHTCSGNQGSIHKMEKPVQAIGQVHK